MIIIKQLKTKNEYTKSIVIIITIITIVLCYVNYTISKKIFSSSVAVCILLLIYFMIKGYLHAYKLILASYEGRKYTGFVIKGEIVRSGRATLSRFKIVYLDELTEKGFYSEPFMNLKLSEIEKYLYYKCDVYVYKGKPYITNVFYESSTDEYNACLRSSFDNFTEDYTINKNNINEYIEFRRKVAQIAFKDKFFFPVVVISNSERKAYVLIEVRMDSKRKYSYLFLDHEAITQFVCDIASLYFNNNMEEFVNKTKQYIVDSNNPKKIPEFTIDAVSVQVKEI